MAGEEQEFDGPGVEQAAGMEELLQQLGSEEAVEGEVESEAVQQRVQFPEERMKAVASKNVYLEQVVQKQQDFSGTDDPMRVVKVQLREQAEAAIKDKVATLSIEEILSDKQPVIEELTHRLRSVAEGTAEGEGLGLKIVTVQIKEAVVSSTTVWENLQKPFRAERDVAVTRARREAENVVSEMRVAEELVSMLPEVAKALPKPTELRSVTVNTDGSGGMAAGLAELVAAVRACVPEVLDRAGGASAGGGRTPPSRKAK